MKRISPIFKSVMFVLGWIFLSSFASLYFLRKDFKPGDATPYNSSVNLPIALKIFEDNSRAFVLVSFFHPQCSCSKASLEAVSRLLAKNANLSSVLVFYKPRLENKNWVEKAALWTDAQSLPRTRLLIDEDGALAKKFQIFTSGQSFLVSAQSHKILYAGGLTPSRGHAGDSLGTKAITEILQNRGVSSMHEAPVYGCELDDSVKKAEKR